jgi:hypothetical protein
VIETLPPDAKLAYSCRQDEEFAFSTPALVGIYAHTGRRVVPMCYEVDFWSPMIGADPAIRPENPFFKYIPQHELFTDRTAFPSLSSVAAFLRDHGIGYIYADSGHPNVLAPDAVPIAAHGDLTILKVR